MWKKPDLASPSPDTSLYSLSTESVGEMLMNVVRDAGNAKTQPTPAPQSECNQIQQQRALLPMLQDYTESVEKCLKSASEFLRYASLISEAREAYEKLTKTRTEIRRVLDNDEAVFRALMDEVQKMGEIARNSAEPLSERKPPESSKIATLPLASGEKTKMSRFP
jgi:hypothetical protein